MSRLFLPAIVRFCLLTALIAAVPLAGCNSAGDSAKEGSAKGAEGEELPEVLSGFVIKADDPTLLFRYVDRTSGEFATATSIAEVPEAARANVIVLSTAFPKGSMPPGLVILTDLTAPSEDGSYPYRLVSRYSAVDLPTPEPSAPAASAPTGPATAAAGSDTVILFSTKWCPHCRHAREWLTSQGIPFVEKDVESDATATALLQQMGQAQGIPAQMLTSVPILAVKGTLVMGFDPDKISALLKK